MRYGRVGFLMLVSFMLLVMIWRQADTLAVQFDSHCVVSATGETFIRVHYNDETVLAYTVEETNNTSDSDASTPEVCQVALSSGWTASTHKITTLRGTEVEVGSQSGGTPSEYTLTGTRWSQPPMFVQSQSQELLERFPNLFFGILAFVAMAGIVGHHWYGDE